MNLSYNYEEQKRRIVTRSVSFVTLFLLCLTPVLPALGQVSGTSFEKVGSEVGARLSAEGQAYVVVALNDPPGFSVRAPLATTRAQVKQAQDAFLAEFAPTGFVVNRRFLHMAAVTGWVTSEAQIRALELNPRVRKVDVDVGGTGMLDEAVPIIRADDFHTAGVTGVGVTVAVLDSGIDSDHPDLVSSIVNDGRCLIDGLVTPGRGQCPDLVNGGTYCDGTRTAGLDRATGLAAVEDDQGHGSHTSGIITSDNATYKGVAPGADIFPIKVLDCFNNFYGFTEIVAAFDSILANPGWGIDAISMSLGTNALFPGDCDAATAWLIPGATAINLLRANGVLAFASAGNAASTTSMGAPACLSNVISVGASGGTDATKNNPASFTNVSTTTDVFAPGVSITSSQNGGGTVALSGTSMSAPMVAGCAALLMDDGTLTSPDEIETFLESSTDSVLAGNGTRYPRLDCSPSLILPVELVKFTAMVRGSGVQLEWETASETNNAGFEVQRRLGTEGQWETISLVLGAGNADVRSPYHYFDEHAPMGLGELYYRLRQIDFDGSFEFSPIVEVSGTLPSTHDLLQNYPNPFATITTLQYELPVDGHVQLTVFDAIGREVARPVQQMQSAGAYALEFDAESLPPGVYMYRLETPGFTKTRRMVILR